MITLREVFNLFSFDSVLQYTLIYLYYLDSKFSRLIYLKAYNVKIRFTFHVKLVLFKDIDTGPIYGPKYIKFGAYSHIYGLWAYGF